MNKNLKFLDEFDRKTNIYEMIVKCAEKARTISSGYSSADSNVLHLAMESFLHEKTDE